MKDINTEALKKWPERIYLQSHGESVDEATWSAERDTQGDVEYVRADLATLSPPAVTDISTQALEPDLPELPKPSPIHYRLRDGLPERMEMYTADQVREAQLAAIEADRNRRWCSKGR